MRKSSLPPKSTYYDFGVVSYDAYLAVTTKSPNAAYSWVKSVLVLAMPYQYKKAANQTGYYLPARFSYGKDYHNIVLHELEDIAKRLQKREKFRYEAKCDISYLEEKTLAHLAGLGSFGKNNLLIHPQFGSFMVLGTLLMDQEFDVYDIPLSFEPCKGCTKCIQACPTQALTGGFQRSKCVSFLSQTKSKSYDLYKEVKQVFYGCDVCQEVCPHNQKLQHDIHPDFLFEADSYLDLDIVVSLSSDAFDMRFQDKNFAWIGQEKIIRNLLVLLHNHNKDISPYLIRLKEENTAPFIKEHIQHWEESK